MEGGESRKRGEGGGEEEREWGRDKEEKRGWERVGGGEKWNDLMLGVKPSNNLPRVSQPCTEL